MRARLGRRVGPLPALAVIGLVGAVLGSRTAPLAPPVTTALAAPLAVSLMVPLVPGVVLTALLARRARRDVARAALALAAAFAVAWGGAAVRAGLPELAHTPARVGAVVEVSGAVGAEPRRVGDRWQVVVAATEVDGRRARERVVLLTDDEPPALGERLSLRAVVRPLPDGGYGAWLAGQHVVALVDPLAAVEVRPARGPAAWTERLRAGLRTAAQHRARPGPAGLVVGLVTGDVRLLPDEDAVAMRDAGLSHLTAVSGSNVALVLVAALGAAEVLRLRAGGRRVLLAVTITGFALLTRFEPSVLRAGTMAALVVAADARGVPREPLHLLAGALVLLLAIDPFLAGSLGLLLSATATLGVLVVAPALVARAPRVLPRPIGALAGVTLSAQLAVAPLLVATFGEVPLVALPANLAAVPLAGIASALAVAGAALVPFAPGAAGRVLGLAAWPAAGVLAVAHRGAAAPATIGARGLVVVAIVVLATAALSRSGRDRGDRSERNGFG
ncbi:MAG: hypothetical protein RLZZ272_702 [Actinomycetota bacterium]